MDEAELQRWLKERSERDDRLYDQYGRALEAEHSGEFVAIGDNGRIILGSSEIEVADQAAAEFGAGAFALRRVGAKAEMRWLRAEE
jgi:hypothetical protein